MHVKVFCHSSGTVCFSCCLLEGLCCIFKMLQRYVIGFHQGDIVFTFFLFYQLLCDFGSVLWIIIMLEYSFWSLLETGGHLVTQYFGISILFHVTNSPPTPFALMQPHISPLPPLYFTVGTMLLCHSSHKPGQVQPPLSPTHLVSSDHRMWPQYSPGFFSFSSEK